MASIFDFLSSYLPTCDNPTVVEIGAAHGEDTPVIYQYLKGNWKYYAFEPDPRSAKIFREKFSGYPQIVFTEAAIGNQIGSAQFYLSGPPHVWSSSLRQPKTHLQVSPQIPFNTVCDVDVTTLDHYFRFGRPKIDFLWCDAQGSELDILKGATETLKSIRCMFLEYSDEELYEGQGLYQDLINHLQDSFTLLHKYDEEVITKHAGDILLVNKELWHA